MRALCAMKFTTCPNCSETAISSLSELFKTDQITCNNCNAKLIHPVKGIVTILFTSLILYIWVIQLFVNEGLLIVISVTALFSISIIIQFAFLLPLVAVKEKNMPRQKNSWVVIGTGNAPSA